MNAPDRDHVEIDGGRLAYRAAGDGRAVVLIHGAAVTADDMMLALADTLAAEYRVIAFDRPGHGGSTQTAAEPGSPFAQAAALRDGWMRLGVRDPLVVGHSFGATVALCLALDHGDAVAGVLALAPICFPEVRLEQVVFGPRAISAFRSMTNDAGPALDQLSLPMLRNAMFLPQIMPTSYGERFPFGWASQPGSMLGDGQDSLAVQPVLAAMAQAYARCTARVTILGGTHDIVVANARHGLVAARMMPNATFDWRFGMGHMLHHFEQPAIARAVAALA